MSDLYEMSEYIRKLNDSLAEHRKSVVKNPPKEVQLLRAMKAFMPAERHPHVDKVIDVMMLSNTCKSMMQAEMSIHPDGVYDIDSNCIANRNNMNGLMLVALAAMMSNPSA